MNEKRTSGGPNVGLLLLIPVAAAAVHMAKRHHRMMWDEIGGPGSTSGADAAARDGFRLPPRIEWILDTWHTRAHQAAEPTDAPAA